MELGFMVVRLVMMLILLWNREGSLGLVVCEGAI